MGPRGQEPNESTDDAVWQDLVARLEGTSHDPDAPGPASDRDRPGTGSSNGHAVYPTDGSGRRGDGAGDGLTDRERADAIFRDQPFGATGPRDYSAAEEPEEDEGFTPDEPPPLGSGDPLTVLAWIGAAGGPVLLLLFAMFWQDAPLAATLGVLMLFLAGAGYLITKLPKHRDMGDDGAEV
ncbi:hypothetical protein FJV46_11635 [Arthrobacter agilis]|uniref:hypothetical protein n=1 Tax=Arthrobacter agilis TaxID=37921 RepID=UPI000B34D707|nr:hypothetical protein [Arthrobacter agilis]OUM45377.1 hypothetical protein B8W74_00890 [Arthrobacter agilis]PPB46994.1 hypothetical protein CI784_04765 [Arthrobacter agilis]TPV23410.1 hypothetical protein FJV46_11635 [Arthrobacter agilis]VDR31789.1 Uncharacterised protein [Arthrobacter agilis]